MYVEIPDYNGIMIDGVVSIPSEEIESIQRTWLDKWEDAPVYSVRVIFKGGGFVDIPNSEPDVVERLYKDVCKARMRIV